MDFITPLGFEKYGINATYKKGDITIKEKGSIVKARAIEVLLRELHNTIDLTGLEPSATDFTQLYQAMRDIGLGWSETRNYRNPTLVIGSNNKLYFFIKPSGSKILLSDGRYAGPKNPINSPTYWEEFTIFRDNGVDNLETLINDLKIKMDSLEPIIAEIIDESIAKLILLHPNNGIANNDIPGHITSDSGTDINDYGKINIIMDNETLLINESTNKLYVNESAIKPSIATTSSVGIVKIGDGLKIDPEIDNPSGGYLAGKLYLTDHKSGNPNTYGIGTSTQYGHVRLTDDFEQSTSAKDGIALTPYGSLLLKNKLLGLKTPTTITTSRTYTVPETAVYIIIAVGGGGNGGAGGSGNSITVSGEIAEHYLAGGGGGGGGGAGERIVLTTTLTKGQQIAVTIGGPGGGTTTFGSLVTARGGGNGSNGNSGRLEANGLGGYNTYGGSGGEAGISYGSTAGGGGSGEADHSQFFTSAAAGGGGSGGVSTDGYYGNGGAGGTGRGYYSYNNAYGPYGGASGSQGVCIITPNIS